jgi:transcriptional regulator with XRE-family HTH domain
MIGRILHLMQCENLSPAEFAAKLGIDRTSISHFISGRNQPSRVFIEKTLRTFPTLNPRWFILGEGEPYSAAKPSTLYDSGTIEIEKPADAPAIPSIAADSNAARKIDEIVIFNNDGTFGRYVEKGK